jgi:hypothetical protein
MRAGLRIGLVGIALVAVASLLGGCGGGSNSAARELHALLTSECGSGGNAEVQLRGLVAGVLATEREFESTGSVGNKSQILQAMKENIAAIHRELFPWRDCTRNVLRRREGKPPLGPVYAPRRAPTDIAIAHRIGPAGIEPGGDESSASPCGQIGEHGVATVWIVPHWSNCLRVPPDDRLAIINPAPPESTGASVQVTIGGYEVWLAPGQKGLIPGRIESYLGPGSHNMGAAGAAFGSKIIVEPKAGG